MIITAAEEAAPNVRFSDRLSVRRPYTLLHLDANAQVLGTYQTKLPCIPETRALKLAVVAFFQQQAASSTQNHHRRASVFLLTVLHTLQPFTIYFILFSGRTQAPLRSTLYHMYFVCTKYAKDRHFNPLYSFLIVYTFDGVINFYLLYFCISIIPHRSKCQSHMHTNKIRSDSVSWSKWFRVLTIDR